MRVHVTLNTLVKDRELDRVAEVIRLLREIRVDAVLVQDAGILRMIRGCVRTWLCTPARRWPSTTGRGPPGAGSRA